MIEMKCISLSFVLVGALFTLLGCGTMEQSTTRQVDIRGDIVELQRMEAPDSGEGDIIGAILIQGSVEADTRYDTAWITINSATDIVVQRDQERVPVAFDDLAVGQRAEVSFAGEVKETYPLQGTAAEVVILE